MSNIHDMEFLQKKVQELKEQGLYKELVTLEGPSDAECVINGKKVINLSSNNYLGLKRQLLRLSKNTEPEPETYAPSSVI